MRSLPTYLLDFLVNIPFIHTLDDFFLFNQHYPLWSWQHGGLQGGYSHCPQDLKGILYLHGKRPSGCP